MENLAKIVHINSLNNGYRFELCMCRSFINRRGGVTEVTYGFTAALGGEIHAHLASPRCLILLKKKITTTFRFKFSNLNFVSKKVYRKIRRDLAVNLQYFLCIITQFKDCYKLYRLALQ